MRKTQRTFASLAVATAAALVAVSVSPAQAAPQSDGLAPDRAASTSVVSSPAAERALAAIQTRIARYVEKHGTRYTFGSYVDSTTGRIVLHTDAPATLLSSLTDLAGATAAERHAVSQAKMVRTTISDASRRADSPPFYGGGGIKSGGALCSSGYAVRTSTGIVRMITAGHCFANGATVTTESGTYTYGTVSNRRLASVTGHADDMEQIGGQSYAGRIFTGGTTSSTSIPVVSAGEATVGFTNYCHSGRTTGENCGHTANSITAQVCTSSGCKSPVIAFTGGTMIQGGDSGGTFYSKNTSGAYIRGHVIATDGTTGWAEKWTEVVAAYSVTIVTG